MDPANAITATLRIAAVGSAITGLELVFAAHELHRTGILNPMVNRTRSPLTVRLSWLFAAAATPTTLRVAALCRVICAVAVFLVADRWALLILSAALLTTYLLCFVALPYGLDGADQMNLVIYGACFLSGVSPPQTQTAATLFLAAMSALAYVSAGVSKIGGKLWRSGEAVAKVLATTSYGQEAVIQVVRRSWVSRTLSYGVIALEVLFPVCFIGPVWLRYCILASCAAMHLGIAVTMGLNNFLWAFVAPYPCVLAAAGGGQNWIPHV